MPSEAQLKARYLKVFKLYEKAGQHRSRRPYSPTQKDRMAKLKQATENAFKAWANADDSKSNPRGQLLFRTRAAAVKYAREHGAKKYSIRKLRTAK